MVASKTRTRLEKVCTWTSNIWTLTIEKEMVSTTVDDGIRRRSDWKRLTLVVVEPAKRMVRGMVKIGRKRRNK